MVDDVGEDLQRYWRTKNYTTLFISLHFDFYCLPLANPGTVLQHNWPVIKPIFLFPNASFFCAGVHAL